MSFHTTPETAIVQYTLLAKNATGKAAAQLITQAVKNPNTFLFGELLHMDNIAELAKHEDTKREYALLELFAYGTYSDYKANRDIVDSVLSDEKDRQRALYKLKQLTVVTLSARQKILPYTLLMQELDMSNVRELEDLLIDSIYQELIKGKLDQREKCFEVHESIGRDIRAQDIDEMIHVLKTWSEHCDTVLRNLEQNTQEALTAFEVRKQKDAEFKERQETILKAFRGVSEGSDMDAMDSSSSRRSSGMRAARKMRLI